MYVDTNVIVAFMDLKDPNHERAVKLLKEGDKVTSHLTVVELTSVYSRAGLEDPQALAIYSLEESEVELKEVDFNQVLREAFKLANKVKLKTLDLLHISSCLLIGDNEFLTFDNDIARKEAEIRELGIEVVKWGFKLRP